MTKYNKTSIYLVCEGKIDRAFSSIWNPQDFREFFVAKKWVKPNTIYREELQIMRETGYLNEITRIITITSHLSLADKKLNQYVKKYGFSKIPSFDLFIIIEPFIMNHDTTLVSVKRSAHKIILFDLVNVNGKRFNAKRYLPRNKKVL